MPEKLNDDFIKKAEIIQMQRDFYKSLLDTLPFSVFAKNKKGEYVYANKYCNKINNFENDELIGKTDSDIVLKKNLVSDFEESDIKVIKNKSGSQNIVPLYINGEFTYQYLIKEPLVDRDGNFAGITGAVLPFYQSGIEFYDSKEGLLLDYIVESGKIIVLREHPDFPVFSREKLTLEEILKDESVFEETTQLLEDVVPRIVMGETPIHLIIKIFDRDKKLRFCSLTLSCFFDKDKKPFRVSGILIPLEESKIREEQMKIEIENAKRLFSIYSRNVFELSIYINPESNFYSILNSSPTFAQLKTSGEWTELVKILMGRFYSEDIDVLKGIVHAVRNSKYYPRLLKNREFRISDDEGNLRWKVYKIDRSRKDFGEGVIFSISDIQDRVQESEKLSIKPTYEELLNALSTVIEFRNLESDNHIIRIREFTKILLRQMNKHSERKIFSADDIELISMASVIHDIGKVTIPDSILLKPGKLTPEEFEIMKTHTIKGCEILKSLKTIQNEKYLKYAYEICRHHHERWDGKGYPDGLVGDKIPLEAQIVSLADVFDALTSERCYKKPFSFDTAFQMILNGDCGTFSPKLMECFHHARKEIMEFAQMSHFECD